MATLVVQNVFDAVTTPTAATCDVGLTDEFPNNPGTLVVFYNGHSGAQTITFVKQKTSLFVKGYGTLTLANITQAVPATSTRFISVPTTGFNDGNGRVQITYSAVTLATIDVVVAKSE